MKKEKIVLAFSGGLDTTFCAAWLKKEKNFDVHGITIDTGGFSCKDLDQIKERAQQGGLSSLEIVDGKTKFYELCIRYLVFGNVLKNGTYPLSVSAERVVQAILLAEKANELGITTIAHGSTGAGNDQVRFDMLLEILIPGVKIITPIRDLKLSREQEIDFLKSNGINFDFSKAVYSINKGIWGTSVGGKETLTSHLPLPEEAWPTSITKTGSSKIGISFMRGEVTHINGDEFNSPIDAIMALQEIAGPYGIGRDIHTGDTIIGIKGRVGFEAAAPLMIIKAHHALEKHVLSKWQLYWKDQLSLWYGNWLHEGQYFEPVMRDIEKMFESSQQFVTGEVFIHVEPNRFIIEGIDSEYDLMKAQQGVYGEMNNGWSGEDVKGFTRIFGNQVKTWSHLHNSQTNKTLQHEEI